MKQACLRGAEDVFKFLPIFVQINEISSLVQFSYQWIQIVAFLRRLVKDSNNNESQKKGSL